MATRLAIADKTKTQLGADHIMTIGNKTIYPPEFCPFVNIIHNIAFLHPD
jgi:hypothetical protein